MIIIVVRLPQYCDFYRGFDVCHCEKNPVGTKLKRMLMEIYSRKPRQKRDRDDESVHRFFGENPTDLLGSGNGWTDKRLHNCYIISVECQYQYTTDCSEMNDWLINKLTG